MIAIVSDIHSNLEALTAVLAEGPLSPERTIEILARRDARVVVRTAAGVTDSLTRRVAEREP